MSFAVSAKAAARGALVIAAALFLAGCIIRVEQPSGSSEEGVRSKSGPLPLMDTSGLDDYGRHKLFATRFIEEGDFGSALEELEQAKAIKDTDPELHELLGVAHDADRDEAAAYGSFMRAGRMYLSAGNLDRAWRILGWVNTISLSKGDPEVERFEAQLRALQYEKNQQMQR